MLKIHKYIHVAKTLVLTESLFLLNFTDFTEAGKYACQKDKML